MTYETQLKLNNLIFISWVKHIMPQESPTVQSHDVAHALVSRKYRNTFRIIYPAELSQDLIYEALQKTDNDNLIIILKIDVLEDFSNHPTTIAQGINTVEYSHTVVFLRIPYELLNTIKSNGYKNAVFYVGTSEDAQRVQVLNGPPTMDMIQTTDREGNLTKFMSGMVCFENF